MYNRYIPQSDGTFQKNRMAEQRQHPQCPNPPPKSTSAPPQNEPPQHPPHRKNEINAANFLKQLLPKNFDTGDLLILILLLLMAGDCEDEKNNALLTLALYFFM